MSVVLNRAANFAWKGFHAIVHLFHTAYEKGVKVIGKEKAELEQRLQRSEALTWYDITIYPDTV